MKPIKRWLLSLSCLICLSSCEGSFSLWGSHYGLVYSKEGHYSLKDGSKKAKNHVFDKPVFAYASRKSGWKGVFYEERRYDYECRCGYRMSYDSLGFEKKEEGMSLVSYKRGSTGYDINSHTIASTGAAYKTIDEPYLFPSTYEGEEVTCIEENAFYDENSEKAYSSQAKYQGGEDAFPSVTTIKMHAFYKSSLFFTSLYFPKVASVGRKAFEQSKVENLSFGEKLTSLGTSGDKVFANSSCLKKVDLSKCPLEEIPGDCFLSSKVLKFVLLPDTIKTIGKHAFGACANLQSIVIPASLETKITSDIFEGYYDGETYYRNQIPVQYFFYKGSAEQAKAIFPSEIESRVYFYSEAKPSEEGSYWHYVDGEPTIYGSEEAKS